MDTNTINCMHEKIVAEDMPSDLGSGKVRVWNCDICGAPFFPDGHFARQRQAVYDEGRRETMKKVNDDLQSMITLMVARPDGEGSAAALGEIIEFLNRDTPRNLGKETSDE